MDNLFQIKKASTGEKVVVLTFLSSLISALLSTPATAVVSLVCTFSVRDSTRIKNVISIGSVGFYFSTWYHSVNIILPLPFLHSTMIFEVYLHIL